MIISHIKLFISVSLPHLSVFRYLSLGTRGRGQYCALGQDTLSSLQGDLELGLGGQWHQPWGDNLLEVCVQRTGSLGLVGIVLCCSSSTGLSPHHRPMSFQPRPHVHCPPKPRPQVHCPPKASAIVPPSLVPGPPTGQTVCPTPGQCKTSCLWCPGTDIEKRTSVANSQK